MSRLLAGVLVAPLAIAPVLGVLFGWWAWTDGSLTNLTFVVLQALVVTYPAMILVGLPIHFALARQGHGRLSHYAFAGALAGGLPVILYCLVAIVVEAQYALTGLWSAALRNAAWGGIGAVVFGAASAAVAAAFWQVAVRPASARD